MRAGRAYPFYTWHKVSSGVIASVAMSALMRAGRAYPFTPGTKSLVGS